MRLFNKIKLWLFKEELEKINDVYEHIKLLHYVRDVKCNCKNLKELHYFYDDDWRVIGGNVFTKDDHNEPFGKLMYCPKCGVVKVTKLSKNS